LAEEINANKNGARTVTLNVRLKSAEHTELPVVSNYTDVHVAQGIAYVNFGFLEPGMLTEVGKHARNGEAVPKHIEGSLTTRVAIPLDSLLRLQQQLTQVLANLQQGLALKQS
jgi:hypothetical protein